MDCNSQERIVIEDLNKYYSVVLAGWNVCCSMFLQCILLFVEEEDCLFGRLCSRGHPVDWQALVKVASQVDHVALGH